MTTRMRRLAATAAAVPLLSVGVLPVAAQAAPTSASASPAVSASPAASASATALATSAAQAAPAPADASVATRWGGGGHHDGGHHRGHDRHEGGKARVATGWTWADGRALRARAVSTEEAKLEEGRKRAGHRDAGPRTVVPSRDASGLAIQGVRSDGSIVASDLDSQPVLLRGGESTPLAAGPAIEASFVAMDGDVVYALDYRNRLLRLEGEGRAPRELTRLPADINSLVVHDGRAYYGRVVHRGESEQARVYSVPLGGGEARVEAIDAWWPTATDSGVLAVRTAPSVGEANGPRNIRSIAVLGHGEARDVLRYTGEPAALKGPAPFGEPGGFSAAGSTLALPDSGGNGQLVVDLASRKAWSVKPPAGAGTGLAAVSATRAAWVFWSGSDAEGRAVGAYTLDTRRGALKRLAGDGTVVRVWINGGATAFETFVDEGRTNISSRAR